LPFGKNHRYDLVIEHEDKFLRVQCKAAWLAQNGSVLRFATANSYYHTAKRKGRRNYRGQCEYFAAYSEELDKVYLVRVDEVGVNNATLRIAPTINNQAKTVRWAKDYELVPARGFEPRTS
jgi:hypothetical protein